MRNKNNIRNFIICRRFTPGIQFYITTILLLFLYNFTIGEKANCQDLEFLKIKSCNEFILPSAVSVKGILGQTITSSEKGRLLSLPDWENGQLIKIFSEEFRNKNQKNDWYGEHGGKWLYSSALAANRTNDKELRSVLIKTADYLIGTQDQYGYLGTYSPAGRITNKDATTHNTSWDVWNLSYMILGLLEVNKYYPDEKYLNAAKNIGELFLKTFGENGADITGFGTRKGLSATIILDPVAELYIKTKDQRYLDFALLILRRIEEKEGLKIISASIRNTDLENIGDGKAYQLIWNLTAITKLYQITGNKDYIKAVKNDWEEIVNHHLSVTGGPWGGIGKHYECFNRRGFWSPYGLVETCSVMAWIQLNRELLKCCGDAKYAQEIERSAYNALPGAQFPNGIDWSYHSFTNGPRRAAHFNDCCPSSGAMALEELSPVIYSNKENGIACNLYTESEAIISINNSNSVRIIQTTNYPFDGNIQLKLIPSKKSNFPVFLRIPDWTKTAVIKINGLPINTDKIEQGEFFTLERSWEVNDVIEIQFPFELRVVKKTENIRTPQGGPDMFQVRWIALTRGPLVYASNGLIAGKNREGTFRFNEKNAEDYFSPSATPQGFTGPAYELKTDDQEPLLFLPFYEAGGRKPGTWRLTWIQDQID